MATIANPNLQNIPVRSELGRQIRAAFAADPGHTLLSADYSQIELRILAHFSEDPVLVEAFRNGEDIHARTAQEVFGVGPMAQTAEHRRAAKAINFGIIYGQTPFGLAAALGIDQKEAAQFINAYFARYRGVKAYLDRSLAEARKAGVTRTMFGRVRPVPEITSPQPNLRSFAERTALNTPLQGTAADLIKLAMVSLSRRLSLSLSECRRCPFPRPPPCHRSERLIHQGKHSGQGCRGDRHLTGTGRSCGHYQRKPSPVETRSAKEPIAIGECL